MRKFFALIAVVSFLCTAATAFAKTDPSPACYRPDALGVINHELPARVPDGFARTDTLNFGYFQVIGGNNYAVLNGEWTFDHGAGSLEGWYAIDKTANSGDYWRWIDATGWSGHGNEVVAPIINGTGSVWVGIYENDADALCWESGLGYGNNWCQRLTSPAFTYTGTGTVTIDVKYFQDSEYKFDYGKVLVGAAGNTTQLNGPGGWSGNMNLYSAPLTYNREILASELGEEGDPRPFEIIFEFAADGGWSDQDGFYTTSYGPMGLDDFSVTGSVTATTTSFNWDDGLQGWTAGHCPGLGSYMAIHPMSLYSAIEFPCSCDLSGNVMAFHNESFHHPMASEEIAWSPPADRTSWQAYNKMFCDWDQYSDMPQGNGTHYRPGWSYYPYLAPLPASTCGRDARARTCGTTPETLRSAVATATSLPSGVFLRTASSLALPMSATPPATASESRRPSAPAPPTPARSSTTSRSA